MVREHELDALARLAKDRVVLELGSALGASASALAKTARQVHCVDHFRGDPHQGLGDCVHEFFNHMRNVPNLIVHVGSFEDVLPLFKSRSFGLVFLDGYHTEAQVTADIKLARRLLRPGGWFVAHDYTITDGTFGVGPAFDRELGKPHEIVESLAIIRR